MAEVTYPEARCVFVMLPWDSDDIITVDALPKGFTLTRNTLRHADKFRIILDYKQYPFDPRAFKTVQVTVYFGDTGSIGQHLTLSSDNEQFIGYADTMHTKLSDGGEEVVFEGRDYTSIFLDRPWDHSTMLDISGTLEQVVKRFLKRVPGAEDIQVEYASQAKISEPSKGSMRPVITEKHGNVSTIKMVNVVSRTKWTSKGKKDDCWTALCDLLDLVALLPAIDKDVLTIRSAQEFSKRVVWLEYGRNLEKLEFLKKSNSLRKKRIRVVSFNPETGEKTEAEYPQGTITEPVRKRSSTVNTGPGSGNSNLTTNKLRAPTDTTISPKARVVNTDIPVITFNYNGKYSKEDLLDKAKEIYEVGARKQIEVTMTTRDFLTYGDTRTIDVANGDIVTVALGNKAATSMLSSVSAEEAIMRLTSGAGAMGYATAADLIAATQGVQGLLTQFRVKASTLNWTRTGGMSLDITAINYVA